MTADTIQEGQLYEGRFRIESLLGRGGMGEVWRAFDLETQREVALKVLLEKAARKRDLVARFEREAKITGGIKSPYVCPLLDSGHTAAGELFLVFQLIPGESLADRLRRPPLLAFDEVASIVDDLLQGLIAAHAAGVVHRDLKPGNLILTPVAGAMPRAVILDFGISKILKRERTDNEASLTTFDATLGSFAYMAPEQVRAAPRTCSGAMYA
ncbi:MAG: serine/threonine protein kinase, partial [Myxococcales bacterium]